MDGASIDIIRINGGRLCLDFVNTAAYEAGRPAIDFVTGFDDLVRWALRQGLIEAGAAQLLGERADARPKDAARALATALELRAALRNVFEPGRSDKDRTAGLTLLVRELARGVPQLSLASRRPGAEFAPLAPGLEAWLAGPLAISAAELVTSPAAANVRMCPGDGCHWLFLDVSRNGTRRWCSMESCGNRAKVRAHYEARRGADKGRARSRAGRA